MELVEDSGETRTYVNRDLLNQVKEKFPETAGMKNTQIVEWALRKLMTMLEA